MSYESASRLSVALMLIVLLSLIASNRYNDSRCVMRGGVPAKGFCFAPGVVR